MRAAHTDALAGIEKVYAKSLAEVGLLSTRKC